MKLSTAIESFRTQQTIHDLLFLANAASEDALTAICSGRTSQLKSLIKEGRCKFETDEQMELYELLSLAASSPEQSDGYAVALAILLADLLQEGLGPDNLEWHWQAYHESVTASSATVRSALTQGFMRAREIGHLQLDPLPQPEDLLTRPVDDILPALLDIVAAASEEELRSICLADHGVDQEAHLSALKMVIENQNCLLNEDQYWYPSEVIELVAHVRAAPGFVTCTALLLINSLSGRDNQSWFEYRWEKHAPDYNTLPTEVRTPMLAGLRYLYESNPEFLSCSEKNFAELGEQWMIPVVGWA